MNNHISPRYAWYAVIVLTLANISSNIDRIILHLLVEPIKRDLQISDTMMSLLMGLSFALLYATMGLPIGRLADKNNRKNIITIGIVAWSCMTVLCGFAAKYWHLFLARVGVGVGEATLAPASYSLLGDLFPKERLATALSIYAVGIYIGAGLAQILGGYVVQFASALPIRSIPLLGSVHSWQLVFFIIGLPGLVIAGLTYLIVDPRQTRNSAQQSPLTYDIRSVVRYMGLHKQTFLFVCVGCSSFAMFSYSASAWIPSLFFRVYGWTPGDFGLVYGSIILLLGSIGSILGGLWADYLTRKGYADAKIRVVLFAAAGLLPLVVLYPQMPTAFWCLSVLLPINVLAGMPWGPAAAAVQEILPPHIRGLGSAMYLFILSIVGLATGPSAVALLTDTVFHNPASVGSSLSIVNGSAIALSVVFLGLALKPFAITARTVQLSLES